MAQMKKNDSNLSPSILKKKKKNSFGIKYTLIYIYDTRK